MQRLISALLILIWPLVTLADDYAPALPALYDVIDVAGDDTLNVRSEPNSAAPILETLPNNAVGLQVVQLSLEGNWAHISQGERSGWVARQYLTAQHTPKDAYGLPPTLTCFGTEPFWSITFTPDGLKLATPEATDIHPITSASPSPENVSLSAMGFRFEWMNADRPVRAHILPGLCNDGMSDAVYGLHYVDNRMMNTGCCSLS